MLAKVKDTFQVHLFSWLLQLYIFYFFSGHIIFHENLNFLGQKYFLIATCLIGISAQTVYIYTKSLLSGGIIFAAWYGMYYINPFIASVTYLITGFFLIFFLLEESPLIIAAHRRILLTAFIYFLSFHYFFSGFFKFVSSDWTHGEALISILKPPVTRDWFYSIFASQAKNSLLTSGLGKMTCLFEMSAVLLIPRASRTFMIWSLIGFHLLLVLTLNVFQLTIPYFIILGYLLQRSNRH